MKKITSLLLLLLVSVMSGVSAWAADSKWTDHYVKSVSEAVTSLDNLNTGYYLLRNVGRQTFLRENDNNGLWLWNATSGNELANVKAAFEGLKAYPNTTNQGIMRSVVYIVKNSDGTYQMQLMSGQYVAGALPYGGPASSNATASKVTIQNINGNQFGFKPEGSSYWANGNGTPGQPHTDGSFTGWDASLPAKDGNGAYQFFPVSLGECVDCSFNVTVAGEEFTQKVVQYTSGTEVSSPVEVSYYYGEPKFNSSDRVATASNRAFSITYEDGVKPFELSTANNPIWYRIYFRNDESNHAIVFSSSANTVTTGNNGAHATPFSVDYFKNHYLGYESFKGSLWAFVRDGAGVKLLNKLTGNYVTFEDENSTASLGNGTSLIVKKNGSNAEGFSLQYPGVRTSCAGDHNNGALALWNTSWDDSKTFTSRDDGGSWFKIVAVSNDEIVSIAKDILNTALTNVSKSITGDETNSVSVSYDASAIETAKEKVASATTLDELDEACVYEVYPTFDENAFYRIKSCNVDDSKNAYITTSSMFVGKDGSLATAHTSKIEGLDRTIRRAPASDNFASQLWQFVKTGTHTYKVKNANTGCRMSSYVNGDIDMPINVNAGGDYTFQTYPTATFSGNDGKTLFQMIVGGHYMNAFGGGGEEYTTIKDYNGNYAGEKGNFWQIIKVSSVPVTISSLGWASVALPCAVQVPSDVKAYYAKTVNGNSMTLEEIEDGIVPANTGVLLAKEGGASVNLAIVTTDKILEGNLLQPATAKRAGFEAQSTYVLARDGEDGDIAFLVSDLTTVPANKAYLNASAVPTTASVLSFTFGGAETGINDAIAEDANETYYDLNGRVVLYPHNGIYVTKSGKKLFIK